jgi:hypothetical protein
MLSGPGKWSELAGMVVHLCLSSESAWSPRSSTVLDMGELSSKKETNGEQRLTAKGVPT